jgi:hypothetical protein
MLCQLESHGLLANPFALLGVSTRDDRDAIAHALSVRLSDPDADEGFLHSAQQSLMAPKPRLEAETCWLPGLAPSRTQAILTALRQDDRATLSAELEENSGLVRANLAAQLIDAHPSDFLIQMLIDAYNEIEPREIAETINAERAVAGFPAVGSHLVEDALATARSRHLDATLGAVIKAEHPGLLMTRLVEPRLKAQGSIREFVDALADRYDNWSTGILSGFEERLDATIARLKRNPKDAAALEHIPLILKDWDEYSQPRQLIFKHKHLDEPRSGAIYGKLRDLAIWLANERNEYRRALVISQALLLTFPELPSVIDQVPEDIETLKELARQAEDNALFGELMEAIENAKNCPTLAAEIERGAFGPGGGGTAGRLYTAFAKAARGALGHEQADLPWHAIRHLALEIHDEHQEIKAALRLTVVVLSFEEAKPSAALAERLREDEATLRRELRWSEAFALAKASRWTAALERLRELETLAADAAERQRIETIRRQLERRRNGVIGRRIASAAAAAVIAFIWLASLESQPTPPRTAGRTPSAPARPMLETPPQAGDLLSNDDFFDATPRSPAEAPPPAGRDRLLTRDQIRYCLFQVERLEAFRPVATTNAQIDQFNRLVDDWNSRCSHYRYREDDMREAERELAGERARLRREGQRLGAIPSPRRANSDAYAGLLEFEPHDSEGSAAPAPDATARLLSPAASLVDAREVQSRLAALGYYAARIDGIWGGGSRRALSNFKRAAGLPANADWDRATQTHLFQATEDRSDFSDLSAKQ